MQEVPVRQNHQGFKQGVTDGGAVGNEKRERGGEMGACMHACIRVSCQLAF